MNADQQENTRIKAENHKNILEDRNTRKALTYPLLLPLQVIVKWLPLLDT